MADTQVSSSQPDSGDDSNNPFLQLEAKETASNPFLQLEQPDPGTLSDVGHGIAHAPTSIESMVGGAEGFAGHAASALGDKFHSDALQALGSSLIQSGANNQQAAQADETPGNSQSAYGQIGGVVRRNAYGVGDMLGQMGIVGGSGAATGAAIGAGVGSIVPGVGTLAGAGAGAALGWAIANVAALPALMGGNQAESTFDAVKAAGVKAGLTDQQAEARALQAGTITGGATAGAGAAIGALGPLGKALGVVGKAAEGSVVKAALTSSVGDFAKGTLKASAEGAAVNAGTTAAVQGTEAAYGDGNGPTASGLIDSAAQGFAVTGLTHAGAAAVDNVGQGRSNNVMADPDADPMARAKAAVGATALIASRNPKLAKDFALYAQNQIGKGESIEIGPDAMYSGFADALRQQQSDAAADDQAAANLTANAPSITDSIGTIMHAGSVDEAIEAAEQTIAGGMKTGLDQAQNLLGAWGVSTPAAVEATPTPDNLATDQAYYADQANAAQQGLREQAFDQTQANAAPPAAPADAFEQRQAQLAAQADAQRQQALNQADADQRTEQADQAPAVTAAQGFDEQQPQSPLSAAMGAELTRLGNRDLNTLTTTQLGALAAHHPDPAIAQQAAEIAAGRRNAAIVADMTLKPEGVTQVGADGTMTSGPVTPAEPEFSAERAAPQEPAAPLTFTTAKGSTYAVNTDGTTTRNKAYRPEHGEQEQGPQPRSEATYYVTPEQADALSEFQTQGGRSGGKTVRALPDGRIGVQYTTGPDAGKFERRTVVAPQDQPAVGLMPVETWQNGARVHFGNAITEVTGEPKRAESAQAGLPGAETTTTANPDTQAAPVARTLADTAPELQPLKAAVDSDARARGQANSGTGFVPVDTASLPDERTPVDNGVAGATTLSKSDAGLLQKTASIFGKKVVLFRQEGQTNGHSLDGAILPSDPGTIYVNADASGAHHLVVVGHELAHQMQTEAPDLYKGLQDALLAHAGNGAENAFYRYYMNRADMSDEQTRQALADPAVRQRMTDEFIADLTGNRFGEYRTWQQVFADAAGPKANKGLVYRIADFITSFINKLLGSETFRKFATDDMVDNLTAVRTQVRRALSGYATQAGAKAMAHEAEQMKARQANRIAGAQPAEHKLVEPVNAEPRADVGNEPSKAAPARVPPRLPEPSHGSQRVEANGTPRTARVAESPERVNMPEGQPKEPDDERTGKETLAANAAEEGADATGVAGGNPSRDGGIGAPAVREDGRVELTHYSRQAGLTEIDPARYGTGLKGAEAKRQAQDPDNFVPRSYYGLNVGKEGGYTKESGLGPHEYKASVAPDKLYDLANDPDDLYPKDAPADVNRTNLYEKNIRDAGYTGYWVDHPSLGKTAAVFDKLKPETENGSERPTESSTVRDGQSQDGGSEEAKRSPERTAPKSEALGPDRSGAESGISERYRRGVGSGRNVEIDGKAVEGERWVSSPEQKAKLEDSGASSPDYIELKGDSAGKIFADALRNSKMENPRGASVHVYDAAEYAKMKLFLTENGKGGVAIKPDGDIVSVFNTPGSGMRRMSESALDLAVQHGGTKLDAFDTILPSLYAKSGFKAVARLPWADEHSPAGWDKSAYEPFNHGEPDVVFMAHEAGDVPPYRPGDGKLVDTYDEATALQQEAVDAQGRIADEAQRQADLEAKNPAVSNPLSDDPQVKASGERASYLGSLDAAQEAAARAVGGIRTKVSYRDQMKELRTDLGAKLAQGIADQFHPIKKLDMEAYRQTRLSKGAETGGLEALMLYGKPFLRDGVLDVDVHDKGFAKVLSSLDGEHGRFFLWVAAQRAEQLKAQGKENLFTDRDISALKTLNRNDAQHPQREAKFAQALKDYNSINDAVLKVAEQSGLLDAATRQMFKDQPYVPFYRAMDDGDGMKGPMKTSGLVNQYAFKKLKGGTNKLNQDLLANTLQNWAHLLGASAKNRAAKLTLDAATKVGAAETVTPAEAGKGAVKVLVDGKPQFYEVEDPHLLAAVSAMSAQVPSWMRPMAAFKRLLTTGTTLSPGFRIRNLIRDTLTVMAASDIKLNPVGNIVQGFKSMDHHNQTFASMLASGGIIQFGSMLEGNEAARAHRLIQQGVDSATILDNEGAVGAMWAKVKQAADVYHEFGNKTENANRGALYEQLIAKGMSHSEASFHARDLMDFSLQGQYPVVRFLTNSVPFLNARIQGAYKIGRAVAENPLRAGTVMGAVALGSLALMLAYNDDPDWKARPDWDRDNYWWFKVGGTAFRIPKPFEVGAVGTLAERSWERMFNPEMTGSRYAGEIRDLLMNQFNLNPVPQIVRPFLNVYANRDDFSGRQIETESMQSLQPEDRYSPYTSMTARFLGSLGLPDPVQLMMGRYSKLSPVQMDYLVNGYFGWLGAATLTAVDAVTRPLSSTGPKPALTERDYTMGFAESLPSNMSRYTDVMYENLDRINQAYASYHAALNSGQFAKAQEVLNTNRLLGPGNRTLISEHGMADSIAKMESRLALNERRVLNSPTLSAETKRSMLNRINQQRNTLAKHVSDAELRWGNQ